MLTSEDKRSPLLVALQLATAAALRKSGQDPESLQVVACDSGNSGEYEPIAGLLRLLDSAAPASAGKLAMLPTLLLGMASEQLLRETAMRHADTCALMALLDWPGLVYLRYGFDAGQLINAAKRARAGAAVPLSLDDRASAAAFARLCRLVRHWAKGRLANTEGAEAIFDEAASGGPLPHSTMLEPISAITAENRDMLSRLIQIETFGVWHKVGACSNNSISTAMDAFEETWQALEAHRSLVRQWSQRDSSDDLHRWAAACRASAKQHHDVCVALERLIAAVDALESIAR